MKGFILPLVALCAFALPTVTAVIWIKKTGARKLPVFVGMLIFFVFAQVLESGLHYVCLVSDNAVSRTISSSAVLMTLYGGFAAGIFEETGRFFAFKTLLRRCDKPQDAVAYGIGHGGIEVFLVLGVSYILYTIAAFAPNALGTEQTAALSASLDAIFAAPAMCLVALVERVFAMLFHICASVLVFTAARDKKRLRLYPLAILLHAVLDMPAMLYQLGLVSILATEALTGGFVLIFAVFVKKLYSGIKADAE